MIFYLRTLFWALGVAVIFGSCSNPCADPYRLRCRNLVKDATRIFPDFIVGEDPLLLDEAIMIGLENNWQVRFQKRKEQIQKELATSETLKMLPSVKLAGEYSHRSNPYLILDTAPSTEQTIRILEVRSLWNLLDFSLAFFQSRISKMQVCLIKQQEARVRHQLILEITESYLNCLANFSLMQEIETTKRLISRRIAQIDAEIGLRMVTETEALEEKNELQKKMLEIQVINRNFNVARLKLLNAMGLPSSTPLKLPSIDLKKLTYPEFDIPELEHLALTFRPELREQDVQGEIDLEQVKMSFARMIPGANFFIAENWDQNKFLVNKNWTNLGVQASYNLLSIPVNLYTAKAAASQAVYTKENRLYMSAAVLSQVNLSVEQAENFWEDYRVARDKFRNRERALELLHARLISGTVKPSKMAYAYADYVLNKSVALIGASNYFTELERLAVSVGIPMMFYEKYFKGCCLEDVCPEYDFE